MRTMEPDHCLVQCIELLYIVLTDGKSNHYHSDCNWDTIEEAAEEVHALGILVYVIGVGNFDHSELEAIASEVPGSISYLSDFDSLEGEQDKRVDVVFKRGIVHL